MPRRAEAPAEDGGEYHTVDGDRGCQETQKVHARVWLSNMIKDDQIWLSCASPRPFPFLHPLQRCEGLWRRGGVTTWAECAYAGAPAH